MCNLALLNHKQVQVKQIMYFHKMNQLKTIEISDSVLWYPKEHHIKPSKFHNIREGP